MSDEGLKTELLIRKFTYCGYESVSLIKIVICGMFLEYLLDSQFWCLLEFFFLRVDWTKILWSRHRCCWFQMKRTRESDQEPPSGNGGFGFHQQVSSKKKRRDNRERGSTGEWSAVSTSMIREELRPFDALLSPSPVGPLHFLFRPSFLSVSI